MGFKQFKEDVARASDTAGERVSNIRRGDSDGELVFTYTHRQLSGPLDIQVLLLDAESYPKCSNMMIFTTPDCSMAGVSSFLEQTSTSMGRKTVQAIIATVSDKLTAWLETSSASEEDSDLDGGSEPEDIEESDQEDYFELEPDRFKKKEFPASTLNTAAVKRMKKDLLAAQAAGMSVGVLPKGPVRHADMFSLSIRVSKLGISEDALKAWDLKAHDYLVLLLRFHWERPFVSDILNMYRNQSNAEFRFGKCAKPKPSVLTARMAFLSLDAETDAPGEAEDESGQPKDQGDDFVPLCMSNSINILLNKEFFRLLNTRRQHMISWDAAQEHLFHFDRGEHVPGKASDTLPDLEISPENDDTPVSANAPASLRHDYALDEESDLSVPLVSMQLALRRLARCTQSCMVCHQRIREEFEALKPYVCSNPLCLYQYISLGFGFNIEHEVVDNPYVVDILVNFFCSALAYGSLREYPTGLNLRSFVTGSRQSPTDHIVAKACFKKRVIVFKALDFAKARNVKEGDCILLVLDRDEGVNWVSISEGVLTKHVCRVTAIADHSFTFEIITTWASQANGMTGFGRPDERFLKASSKRDWDRVLVFQYTHDVDGLSQADRSVALMLMTHAMPSVLKMRAYLLQNPGRRLSSWNQMDRNSLTLLHWIVASNRSLLLQDDNVPDPTRAAAALANLPGYLANNANKVLGMSDGWMQFRFLQGTPERERLFVKELSAIGDTQDAEAAQFPTLFAWHGSPLYNWHSIIRTGLDFQSKLNGRAFGNGVYFSSHLTVSSTYMGNRTETAIPNHLGQVWINSQLRPQSALSICEIINRRDRFVASTPHYVVDKLEWIQCRYLFVQVQPTASAQSQPFPTRPDQDCEGYVPQSPDGQLYGQNGNIEIPLSALSSQRRRAMAATAGQHGPVTASSATPTTPEVSDSDDEGQTDYALLMDSDDYDEEDGHGDVSGETRKRRCASPGLENQTSPTKLGNAAHIRKTPERNSVVRFKTTKFQPGTLDLDRLPKLPEPSWAASSPGALRSLNRAIMELQQMQAQEDTGTLGWYIDFHKLSNVFHWVVELHSFDAELPLAQDMERLGCNSIVLELRFGGSYPFAPPFVRVIRPRFLPFMRGGGGHVTAGGAICSEMLTNTGWSPAMTIDKVLLQVRLGLCDLNPPARLDGSNKDYGIGEAIEAYTRAARAHGWQVPADMNAIASDTWGGV